MTVKSLEIGFFPTAKLIKINKNDRTNIDNSTSGQLDFIKKFRQ